MSVSDICVVKTALVHSANDVSEQYPTLLSAPRPAPRLPATPSPGYSPVPSPDSFHLTFTDTSFLFPHPPILTPTSRIGSESPTPSMSTSDTSTTSESQSTSLPTTPSSDDEFPSYYSSAWPSFSARRASIKPLVITKINPPTIAEDSDRSTPHLRQPFKNSEELQFLNSSSSPPSDEHSSDNESDSEWYTREFSKILTLSSCLPPSFPQQSRPESILVPSATARSPMAAVARYPTAQLDPAFPRRRHSRASIPPHPVPTTSTQTRLPPTTTSPRAYPRARTKTRSSALSLRRPPPRSSIPADCVFGDPDTSYYALSDDSASAFSFSMYDSLPTPTSPKSIYSQCSPSTLSSFPKSAISDEFEFNDVDVQFATDTGIDLDNQVVTLPSLPCSPIDLEADIASGLKELRLRGPAQENDVFCAAALTTGADEPQRVLRSKWSSSTLNSIRDERQRRSASAKLRAYFNTSINSPSSKSQSSSSSRKLTTPTTPTTPSLSPSVKRFKHPRREMYTYTHTKKDLHSYLGAKSRDGVIMGYEQTLGLKRRGSLSPSVSDVGSDDGSSSSESAGLRRKPIPVEMFLRSAA